MADPPDDPCTNEQALLARGLVRWAQPDGTGFDNARFTVVWVRKDRQPAEPADPTYPNGAAIDVAIGALRTCQVALTYPAAGSGLWVVSCTECGFAIALAAAGRADDPASVRVPCRLH